MPPVRPGTVVMVAFATGSVTIQCRKTKAEVIALMNVPDYEPLKMREAANEEHPDRVRYLGEPVPTRVMIPSISETDVKHDPRSSVIAYRLTNEMIEFRRKDVVFWSVSEAVDPPLIQEVPPGIAVMGR